MTTPKKTTARAVAETTDGVILATTEIAAPPERVFRALTSPEEIVKWWGSDETYRTTTATGDLRVGGKWRSEGKSADGQAFYVEGEYVEIDPPRTLVQTWRARVTVKHEGFAGRPESCRGHAEGWQRVLGWLDGYAAPLPADTGKFFFCRLLPPRPSFASDMTPEERAMMQEHLVYWTGHLQEGRAIVFGPVADPAGPWGLGVVRVADEAAMNALAEGDPAIRGGRGLRYEILPLIRAVTAT